MNEYQFKLQRYTGSVSRYACPSCKEPRQFTLYVDIQTGEPVNERVGICNRLAKCGYHYTPKQYFAAHNGHISTGYQPTRLPKPQPPSKRVADFLPWEVVKRSLQRYNNNAFVRGLSRLLTEEVALDLASRYYIGTTKEGGTIFWQVDENQMVRTGKIILYDAETIKRCKQGTNGREIVPQWAHIKLKNSNFKLQQCLFGQHLLATSKQPVAIVEGEKTAVLCSVYLPQYTWLATGGCSASQFKQDDVIAALSSREVLLFPDTGATDKWTAYAKVLRKAGVRVQTRNDLEAPELARPPNWDLADEFLSFAEPVLLNTGPMRWALNEPDGYPVFWDYDAHT